MHPTLLDGFVREHQEDLRHRLRPGRARARRRRGALRHRLGWLFVEYGLRLVAAS